MTLSNENNDFLIKVVKDCYTKLQDENNILNETVRMFDEERTKQIITIQSLNGKLSGLNKKVLVQSEVLEDIQIELTHNVSDEDKIENIREIIARYLK